jgi:hypothetical protein
MGQHIEWVRDAEELEAWKVESERILRKLDPLNTRYGQVLTNWTEIRDRGLARTAGKGFRLAIFTSDEVKEMDRLWLELRSLDGALRAVDRELLTHHLHYPRPQRRKVED